MAEENYGALYQQAIAESGLGSEILPDGAYNVKIGTIKPDTTRAGKFKVGIRLQVLDGPYKDKSCWINQSWSPTKTDGTVNVAAISIFIRLVGELGVPAQAIAAGLPPAQLIAYIVQGSTGVATLSNHINGVNADGTPKHWQDLKSFRVVAATGEVGGSAPAPVAAAAPAPALPVPEAAPAAPEAPAAPVAAPPLPVAPPLPAQPGQPVPGAVPAPF